MKSKYDGLILDGLWKFKSSGKNGSYIFENIYNHTTITISQAQLENVKNGKDTIGHIMSRRIGYDSRFPRFNGVVKLFNSQKHRFVKEVK